MINAVAAQLATPLDWERLAAQAAASRGLSGVNGTAAS